MRYLIILAVLIGGCAAVQHTPIKSPYAVPRFSEQELDKVLRFAAEEIGGDMRGWSVTLIDTYIIVQGQKKGEFVLADGITLPHKKQIIVFAYQSCLADSSLIHEIGHAAGWTHKDFLKKLLHQLEERAIKELCPEGYVSGPKPDPSLMGPIVKSMGL